MPRSKIVRDTTEELKEMEQRGQTRTDWRRVKAMKDKDIVIGDDAPEPTAEQWAKAVVNEATRRG